MSDKRRLIAVWLGLMALTALTGIAGRVTGQSGLNAVFLVLLALASMVKARLILSHYLDLRRAPDWNRAFDAVLYGVIIIIYGLSAVASFG
ncbi:MAG: cytochrome C oxidase subunit IV family protein [Brucellaceae bacterium]|nr:cytochrome C oxidase subunit IV family protein [Brucellaceae bacterium]